jgi:hypothetical protein
MNGFKVLSTQSIRKEIRSAVITYLRISSLQYIYNSTEQQIQ